MYEQAIDITRKEVLRLISQQKKELLEQLLSTQDLLKSQEQDKQQRNLNREDIEQWLEILRGEAYKAERLEVTFAVVGTMKAGKSTTINAIVGTEVLPNRNQPMTALPTIIRHIPGKREPELTFPNPQPFNEIVAKLKDVFAEKVNNGELDHIAFCATEDGKEMVARILNGSMAEFRQSYKGTEEIFEFLKYVNDIWRLCADDSIGIDLEKYLDEYNEIHEFPAIEVEFFHLRGQGSEAGQGRFTLIDTPGPNEAGQTYLKHIMREQLTQASAVLAVLDYTQLNAEADAEVRRSLEEIEGLTDSRLFVLVNKFDQKDRHGMDTEELRSYIVKNLFNGRLAKERIHPVSSKFGYLANRALFELSVLGKLPDYRTNPWVEDFGNLALGACWESDISDLEEVEFRANKLWKKSLFDKPLTEVVRKGFENSALMSLKSAVSKMLEYDRRIVESLKIRQTALNMDIKAVEQHIRLLEEDIRLIKETRDDARKRIDDSIAALQLRIDDLFKRCECAAKAEVQTIFSSQQCNNWVSRRLQGFIDLAPNRKTVEFNFDAEGYNDFETETEARHFLNKVIETVASHIEPVLEDMQQATQDSVDEMTAGIWTSVNRRLEKVLKAAADRLNETFPVTLEFPRPRVRTVRIDFYELRQGAVKEDTVTKTGSRKERRWYTMWCHKHDTTYQYQEQVFRVYTLDIAKRLQVLLEEDHKQLRQMLDKFVQDEFSKAINLHFSEIANYLERFRGDLLDSKRDQELAEEKLDNLQVAMKFLYAAALAHSKSVQSVEEELPGTETVEVEFAMPQLSLPGGLHAAGGLIG